MENLITLRQREAEFFGGMDYAARRAAVEAAHEEALEENDLFDGIIRDGLTPEQRKIECHRMGFDLYGNGLEIAHAEALEMDKQITHFRKEQAALSQRVAVIMGKAPV